MDWLHAFILAVLQGTTEFLPISSSAHLILLPRLFGWIDQKLVFDVAVHVGTLTAVLYYFRHQLLPMASDWFTSLRTRKLAGEAGLVWAVLLGTLPVGIAGLIANSYSDSLRNPLVIGIATIAFALLLAWADKSPDKSHSEYELNWKAVAWIGFAQALALIPGTSRSGITMTAGLFVGLSRTAAARFSFLLSIPVIVLAGGLKTFDLLNSPVHADLPALAIGVFVSAISAYACIHVFIKLLERIGMMPFVIYRLILGAVILLMVAP